MQALTKFWIKEGRKAGNNGRGGRGRAQLLEVFDVLERMGSKDFKGKPCSFRTPLYLSICLSLSISFIKEICMYVCMYVYICIQYIYIDYIYLTI